VNPVPDPQLLKNLVAPEIEPGTSGSVARNSDHKTTEAYSSSSIIRIIKSMVIRLGRYVAHMGEMHTGFWWKSQKEGDH
jgi:hypothetical protein